jgi:hypothetical protein
MMVAGMSSYPADVKFPDAGWSPPKGPEKLIFALLTGGWVRVQVSSPQLVSA